jgi:N-acetylglutamate synthase-like GNAT family acetyltransferase
VAVTVRTDWRAGDLGAVVTLHALTYSREHGFDATFEAYVAGPLSEFVLKRTERDCLWLAEDEGRLIGCIAIVSAGEAEAQLRWYVVSPEARGKGLGKLLLDESLAFCRRAGYRSVYLWTVSRLERAAALYRAAGFQLEEEKPGAWGTEVVEQKYRLSLA